MTWYGTDALSLLQGKTFDIPERVPFRLTHNLVDGLGTTGVEGMHEMLLHRMSWRLTFPLTAGVYRKAAEIALETLRNNRDSLMSVLEAFIHDPLVEWEEQKRREVGLTNLDLQELSY